MHIVHFGHSCVLLDTGSARLLIDPGSFSTGFEQTEGLDAVLITHQHFDHVDQKRLPALLAANPGARLVVDPDTVGVAKELGLEHTVATVGDKLTLAGATVEVIGGQHASIYGDLPGITNAAYLVDDGAFLHPGDSLAQPGRDVDVLGVPVAAPWLKLAEAVDFIKAVRPRAVVPIHEALYTEVGVGLTLNWFNQTRPAATAEIKLLAHGQSTAV
ncbi:MBL fold metallo-hydrolase [Kutzneria sp. NPDC052558]|uniref:MBL fold metallo-hydrolase n=1 Tax=Kutzneria sp. NPDC052558 TaxID=3364121 RepID=UPI0037C72A7F